jgi:hypothetical protein
MVKERVKPSTVGFQRLDVAAQDAHAERVEGGDQMAWRATSGRASRSTRSAISLAALLVKGDGQDGVGRDVFLVDEPGDAVRDDAGFARSGAGKDEQRAFGSFDSGALFGIQMVEELLQGVYPGEKFADSSVTFGLWAITKGCYQRFGILVTNGAQMRHRWVSERCNAGCIYHLETA